MKQRLFRTLSVGLAASMALSLGVCASAKTITLQPSGYAITTGDAAPTQSKNASLIGGNTGLFTFSDFSDLTAHPEAKDAVNWWLSNGVTNGGKTFTTFGASDPFCRYDLAFFLYRFYGIVNDDGMWFYDDVPINQMGSTIGMKFNDPVTNVRWSGIMSGVGALSAAKSATGKAGTNCFDPYGSVTTEQLLITLYRLINWTDGTLGAGHPEVKGQTTMQVNKNFKVSVTAVSAAEADTILGSDVKLDSWAKPYVAAMVKAGLYTPASGEDMTSAMTKLQVVEDLYKICAGTGARQQMTTSFLGKTDNDFTSSAALKDKTYSIGDAKTTTKGQSLMLVHNGADVSMTGCTFNQGNMGAAFPYPLSYRWGDSATILAYGEGTKLTLKNCTFNWENSTFAHQSVTGLQVECGATIVVDSCSIAKASGLMCYNGTLVYKDSVLNGADRITSSDFFSGVVVYDNTTVNKDNKAADGSAVVGGAFSDESCSTYVLNSSYFGAGSGNQTGISTFYGYKSNMVMSPTNCTNNTSMLSDVTSTILENCTVSYSSGIAKVVREGKYVAKYVNCGEVKLGTLGADDYDVWVSGTEFGSYGACRIYLDGSTFSRPLKVFVANGCSLEIFYTGSTAPQVEQDTSVTKTVECFANTAVLPSVNATNTGTVTVTAVK